MSTKTKSQDKHKMSEIDEQILTYFDIKRVSLKLVHTVILRFILYKDSTFSIFFTKNFCKSLQCFELVMKFQVYITFNFLLFKGTFCTGPDCIFYWLLLYYTFFLLIESTKVFQHRVLCTSFCSCRSAYYCAETKERYRKDNLNILIYV